MLKKTRSNMTQHALNCPAPICMDCIDDNHVWYIGEPVCKKTPTSIVQKRQNAANSYIKKHPMKNADTHYTYTYLKTHSI